MTLTATALCFEPNTGVDEPDLTVVSFLREKRSEGEPVPPQDARRVEQMRRVVVARLRFHGLDDVVEDAALVVSELVTNELKHGGGADVRLSVSCSREAVHLEVGTSALPVDGGFVSRPRPQAPVPDDEGGRGLLIVGAITTMYGGNWGVSPDSTTTWCTLPI